MPFATESSTQASPAPPVTKKMNPRQMAGIRSLFTHDTSTGVLEELNDVPNLRTVGHLILDLVDDIEHARLTMEEQTIGIGDVFLYFLVDTGIIHHRGVRTTIGHGVATSNDIGRHIVREGASSLDEREVAGTGIGVLDGSRGEDDTAANLTVARNLRAIAEHAVGTHDGIVADVRTFEQEVVVPDDSYAVLVGAAVDNHILTDNVVVANLHIGFGTTEVEILRERSDHTALVNLVVIADT